MAIETLMMTFGRPKQQADEEGRGRAGWDEAGHLPRKENNNKLKAAHKQIYTGSLYACVCVCGSICVLFRFRRGQENITNRFWLPLAMA